MYLSTIVFSHFIIITRNVGGKHYKNEKRTQFYEIKTIIFNHQQHNIVKIYEWQIVRLREIKHLVDLKNEKYDSSI